MSHLNLAWLEEQLVKHAEFVKLHPEEKPYLYVETGRYKPFHITTVKAAIRRGYQVEAFCSGTVFYVYPKGLEP